MDFSIFDKKTKPLNEVCEIIVVDFINKKEVLRTLLNNLAPVNPQQMQQLAQAQEQVTKTAQEYIEKSQGDNLGKNEEKQEFSA